MTLAQIVATIKQTQKPTQPILIAIEGFGGSGKTTIANQLKTILGDAYVISIDDFIIKEKVIATTSWEKDGFDRDRLEQQVLIPATTGQPIRYQQLIWQTNSLSDPIEVPTVKYLIIEGISSYHPNIEKYYDYKIWIDTPMEIAKKRGHAREGSHENAQYWDLWADNDLKYKAKYHPEQRADFVISNGDAMQYSRPFLGKTVTVKMDRPLGSKHPKYGHEYPVNYGFIPNTKAPDGSEIDAYVLGIDKPVQEFTGTCIAIIHRTNDDDDKLIVVPEGQDFSDEQIRQLTHFQEQWFESDIIRK